MRQASGSLSVRAPSRGLHEITREIADWTVDTGISEGLLTVFCRHTSASLVIQENAAPAAKRDLERYFERIAPEGADYEHDDEGPDDMPAHLRSALTQTPGRAGSASANARARGDFRGHRSSGRRRLPLWAQDAAAGLSRCFAGGIRCRLSGWRVAQHFGGSADAAPVRTRRRPLGRPM